MKQHPIELVGFAKELLKKQRCPFCDKPFSPSDVMAQGNRRGKDGKSYYYYETHCGECSQPSMTVVTSRPMDTRGLMQALTEHYQEGSQSEYPAGQEPDGGVPGVDEGAAPPPPPKASGISDAEVQKAKRMLDKAKSWDDVMRGLGMSGEVIERYTREGGEKDARGDDESK